MNSRYWTRVDGILGVDFFIKNNACIDYERRVLSFYVGEQAVEVPLEGEEEFSIVIPARCEKIFYFSVVGEDECVVKNEEVSQGVLVASTLVKPVNGRIPVKMLNTRNEPVKICNYSPSTRPISDFTIHNFQRSALTPQKAREIIDLLQLGHLKGEEYDSIYRICLKYFNIFHHPNDQLGVTNLYKENIVLEKSARPAYRKPYRQAQAQRKIIEDEIEKMLKNDIIEETRSPWSAPLLVVPKKLDGTNEKKWRVVIDYRELNERIVADKFPLPNISEILDSLSGAVYFSHLDLSSGYYQVELEAESRPCTAFVTDKGQYQMKRLPMGLKTSPSAFSRLMTVAVSGLNYESCFVYLDDLIVYGRNLESHNKNLIKVFERLREVNLKLNPAKCEFLKKDILYLGHVVSEKGIQPDPEKISALEKWPTPQSTEEVKRVVAFMNYYRKFIPNFAELAVPLNQLTKKGINFSWSKDCQYSFNELRRRMMSPPVLQFPDFSEDAKFILRTDASRVAIGAVLSNSNDLPVAYSSRPLSKAEKNYAIIELELLAIVWAVQHFRPYLFGRKFEILTDHRPLVYLFGMRDPSSRLLKFRLKLEDFDFTIRYVKGTDNVTADALSRIVITSDELKEIAKAVEVNVVTRSKTRLAAEGIDQPETVEVLRRPLDVVEIRPVEGIKEKVEYNKDKNEILFKSFTTDEYAREDTLLELGKILDRENIETLAYYTNKSCADSEILKGLRSLKNVKKILMIKKPHKVIERATKEMILNEYHMSPTSGHFGSSKMYETIRRRYYWATLKKDIEEFIKRCSACQRNKHGRKGREKLVITTQDTEPLSSIELDLVGPLPVDNKDFKYILSIHCKFSRYIVAIPIKDKRAQTVAEAFINNFILIYGVPRIILTDRGKEFTAELLLELCGRLKMEKMQSTAFHHQTMGITESSHKHLGAFLRIVTDNGEKDWSDWVQYWAFAYNSSVHVETRYSPFELVFGKSSRNPSELWSEGKEDEETSYELFMDKLRARMEIANKDVIERLNVVKDKRKTEYDKVCNEKEYEVGDKVLVRKETGSKLARLYDGPFEVVGDNGSNIYIRRGVKVDEVHKDRVKHFVS